MKAILLSVFLSLISFSQVEEIFKSNIYGKEFWFTLPPAYIQAQNGNATQLYIFSKSDGTVEINSGNRTNEVDVKANELTIHELSPNESQTYIYNIGDKPNAAQVYDNKAVNISSDVPIKVTLIARYVYTSDGTTLIPTEGLGNEYVCSSYDSRAYSPNALPGWWAIVGTEDNTSATLTIGGNNTLDVEILNGENVSPGDNFMITLNEGDVYLMSSKGPQANNTLSGSHVKADKPIATFSGHFCTDIPSDNRWCDYTVTQDIPLESWGNHIFVPYAIDRYYPGIMRVFASENDTKIYKNGVQIGQIGENDLPGGRKNYCWIEERIWARSPENVEKIALISGDKPIGLSFYNPSTQEDAANGGTTLTDPFMTVIPSEKNMAHELYFNVPGVVSATPFQKCWFNIVYETDENGLIPEDVEIGILENGEMKWRSFRDWKPSVDQEYTIIGEYDGNGDKTQPDFFYESELTGKRFKSKTVEIPNVGQYAIKSPSSLVSVMTYGYEDYGSFGYHENISLRLKQEEEELIDQIEATISDGEVIWDEEDSKFKIQSRVAVYEALENTDIIMSNENALEIDRTAIKYDKKMIYVTEQEVLDPTQESKVMLSYQGNDIVHEGIVLTYTPPRFTYTINGMETDSYDLSESYDTVMVEIDYKFEFDDLMVESVEHNDNIFDLLGVDNQTGKSTIYLKPKRTVPMDLNHTMDINFKYLTETIEFTGSRNIKYGNLDITNESSTITINSDFDINLYLDNIACNDTRGQNNFEPLNIEIFDNDSLIIEYQETLLGQDQSKDLKFGYRTSRVGDHEIRFEITNDLSGECSNSDTLNIFAYNPLSVSELPADYFNISPTPAKEKINVDFRENSNGSLKIISSNGLDLYSLEYSNEMNIDVDLSNFSSGVYFIEIETNEGLLRKKFIKN